MLKYSEKIAMASLRHNHLHHPFVELVAFLKLPPKWSVYIQILILVYIYNVFITISTTISTYYVDLVWKNEINQP